MDGQDIQQVVTEVCEGQRSNRGEWYVQCVSQTVFTRTKANVCSGLEKKKSASMLRNYLIMYLSSSCWIMLFFYISKC